MGHPRRRPERLAEKLKKIRNTLGLSQTELHKSLGVEEDIPYTRISDYELGKNAYAHCSFGIRTRRRRASRDNRS